MIDNKNTTSSSVVTNNKHTKEYQEMRYAKLMSISKGRVHTHKEHLEVSMLMHKKTSNLFNSIIAENKDK